MAKQKLPVAQNVTTGIAADREFNEMEHKAKYALEDIERAEGHKKDKELMKHVKKAAKDKIKSMSKICGD